MVWAVTGPLFHFGDTWQLVINTGTTIVTFLMVFLIQNTQNRDSAALQIKLDELIRATAAHNDLLGVEGLDEDALERIRASYQKMAEQPAEAAAATVPTPAQGKQTGAEVAEIERELHHDGVSADKHGT
jgi:low affinity Fe/Cu permease